LEEITHHVPRGIVDFSHGAACIVIRLAQVTLLFFLAANLLRYGCVADAFDDGSDDGDG